MSQNVIITAMCCCCAVGPMYIERAAIVKGEKQVEGGDAAGIPNFWQTVLMRCDVTRDIMNEKDIEVLKYLADIKVSMLLGSGGGGMV